MSKPIAIGDVLTARFPSHLPPGHEQSGYRPAIVVGLPERLGVPRFPTLLLVPLTTDREQAWAAASPKLYPRLAAGAGGLPSPSIVLLEQVRALSTARIGRHVGMLTPKEYEPIREGLERMCRVR